jgi:hypothetical protein
MPPFIFSKVCMLKSIFFPNGSSIPFKARPLIQFGTRFSQTVGRLGRVISPSQGRYQT